MFAKNTATRVLGHVWALILIGIGWMIFDHTDLTVARDILSGLVGIGTVGLTTPTLTWVMLHSLPLILLGAVAATPAPMRLWKKLTGRHPALTVCEPVILLAELTLAVACMVSGTYSPFLYFNF